MAQSRFKPMYRRARIHFGPGWLLWLMVVACTLSFGLHLLDLKLRPAIVIAAKSLATRTAREALNTALTEEVVKVEGDGKLVDVERGPRGEFRSARFNLPLITRIQSQATENARFLLNQMSHETLKLPFTQVMGGTIFASVSPEIPIRLVLLGSAHSSIVPAVQTVGINQTVHILYLDLTADVNVVAPFITTPVTVHSRVPLSYIVLSGPVPNSFYGSGANGPIFPFTTDHP